MFACSRRLLPLPLPPPPCRHHMHGPSPQRQPPILCEHHDAAAGVQDGQRGAGRLPLGGGCGGQGRPAAGGGPPDAANKQQRRVGRAMRLPAARSAGPGEGAGSRTVLPLLGC